MPTPSKGDRAAMTVRAELPVAVEVRRRARSLGMSASDYIAAILARAVGMPELAPVPPVEKARKLPITG